MKKWIFAIATLLTTHLSAAFLLTASGFLFSPVPAPAVIYWTVIAIAYLAPLLLAIKVYEHFLWKEAKWQHTRYAKVRERLDRANVREYPDREAIRRRERDRQDINRATDIHTGAG